MAESFGLNADKYDRARPTYPQVMADAIVSSLPGRKLLDVGIGTGISAAPFVAAGCEIVGVEVDVQMAEIARQRGLTVEIARFEDWNPKGRLFDGVISGQTWHWIDPAEGAMKASVALRPNGRIALFWNVAQPSPEVAAAFGAVYRRVDTGLPFQPWAVDPLAGYSMITEKAIDGINASEAFGEVERLRFDWERSYTREEWLDGIPTAGGHNRIAPDRLAELIAGIGEAIDEVGGSIIMGYASIVLTAARTSEAVTLRSANVNPR